MRACLKVIFAMTTNRLIALTMNVIASCFTNTALWQRNIMPCMVHVNDFTTHAGFVVACTRIFKRNVAHVAG